MGLVSVKKKPLFSFLSVVFFCLLFSSDSQSALMSPEVKAAKTVTSKVTASKTTGDQPNVVVIISDDFPYRRFTPFNGYKKGLMPHISSIVKDGTFFSQGYVSGPFCAPTRAGLLTGRHQSRYGYERSTKTIGDSITNDTGVDTKEIFLPKLMKKSGYRTAAVGKWHLGYNNKYRPNSRGFDYFFGFLPGGHSYMIWDQTKPGYKEEAGGGPIFRNNTPVQGKGYLTEAFGTECAKFITDSAKKKEKFFLYYAPFNVHGAKTRLHGPVVVPKKYLHKGDELRDGMIRGLDHSVGTILKAISDAGIEKDTLVIFVNDNGGGLSGIGDGTKRGRRQENAPYRDGKFTLYEGGVRVPFAMKWPGRIPAGKTYDKPVIQFDILPTLLGIVGQQLPKDRDYDGVNLMPFLTGKDKGQPHETLVWRSCLRGPSASIRVGDLKLFKGPRSNTLELYDLKNDPGEKKNLAKQRPQDVKRLIEAYHVWHKNVKPPIIPEFRLGVHIKVKPKPKKPKKNKDKKES